uniref:DNA helicase n=1 Tax=Opuntia streptacantha TaxID=393608 RepID=A0A7C9DAY5_OPUST
MQENSRTLVRKEDKQATEYESTEDKSLNHAASLGDDHTVNFIDPNRAVVRKEKDNPELGNVDIMYSQNLVVRDANPQFSTGNATESGVINFKRFRKTNIQSGNSFTNLVPFSKYPYTDSDYDKEISEYVKEEKKRKQMEAVAEDLFNTEKGRRRGVAGSLQGLLRRD